MPPASSVSNDANSFMPLLFAAHPEVVPNYKRMAAMDDQGRTASALEHKFRAWRQDGKKILAEKGGNFESMDLTPKKPTAVPKKTSVRGGGGQKKPSSKAPRSKGKNEKDVEAEDEEGEESEDGGAADTQLMAEVGLSFAVFTSNTPMNDTAH